MDLLVGLFSVLMDWCHWLIPNYWVDIVLFTAITKLLQFPITLWCHSNSLKMVSLMPQTNGLKIRYWGDKDKIGEETAALFRREKYHPLLTLLPLVIQIVILMGFVRVIHNIAGGKQSCIALIPIRDGGVSWLMPVLAGGAACFLGWCQNRINPLQHEQTRIQQLTTNGISVCISLFLGAYVAMGVGLYWAASNFFSIITQLWCNWTIRPQSRIDYAELYRTKAELQELEASTRMHSLSREERLREKSDYKRFFSVANKHIVFYAESKGFYRYFKSIVEWLLAHTNLTIHYVTNDSSDPILGGCLGGRVKGYFVGPVKMIPLFMKMDSDAVVMTTPDLNTYQIKRSYVKKDVEYIYVGHGMSSMSLTFRNHAFDHFDTIFVNGQYHVDEHRSTEKIYGLKPKNLVKTGYPYLDLLLRNGAKMPRSAIDGKTLILIGPSYQEDNILESCLAPLIECLVGHDRIVVVRPHPQYMRRSPAKVQALIERYKDQIGDGLKFETDFSDSSSIESADILITDWSSIAFEFVFTSKRPAIFVDTPMKVTNPEWERIGIVPNDITYRNEIGVSVRVNEIEKVKTIVADMMSNPNLYKEKIDRIFKRDFFNPGRAGEVAGRYILDSLLAKQKARKA